MELFSCPDYRQTHGLSHGTIYKRDTPHAAISMVQLTCPSSLRRRAQEKSSTALLALFPVSNPVGIRNPRNTASGPPPSISPEIHGVSCRFCKDLMLSAPLHGEDEHDLHSDAENTAIVPFSQNYTFLSRLPKDEAMSLVLSAAVGKGWTTGSGMEGPTSPDSFSGDRPISTFPWSLFTKSPRRRMRVSFTCNICGQRTTRAINPHAYTDGTVFVQCCGCNVFHKLVDNLNLFHEMRCYVNPTFRYKGDARFDFLDGDDDGGNIFPVL
ncbi:hypothetical protein KSP39_PZI022700 [Platanthera zijinensis]|uniref:DNL-type domain-containing protein n=1 Tax=Platanthera zijinensis TaxID=2320716 RepID=A0AAP0AVV1_9ASPA